MLKTKFILGRTKKQGSKRSHSQVTIVERRDEDPFLANIRRSSKPYPPDEMKNDGKILKSSVLHAKDQVFHLENKPCLPKVKEETFSKLNKVSSSDLENGHTKIESEVQSIQVKYTDTKQIYKYKYANNSNLYLSFFLFQGVLQR